MSYGYIYGTDAIAMDPDELLSIIESDTTAFLPGRRNDDVVNWVLTVILGDIAAGSSQRPYYSIMEQFNKFYERMAPEQRLSMEEWEESSPDVTAKAATVYDYYKRINDPRRIADLWITNDYYRQTPEVA